MNTPTEDALRLLPQDLSRVVESVMHVYQGNHDHLPDLLSHAGTVLLKAGRRMSTTQLLMIGGLLMVGALLVIRQTSDDDEEEGTSAEEATESGSSGARNGEHRAASKDKP
jgi:hypothetical protein